jgi:hypothetical protein
VRNVDSRQGYDLGIDVERNGGWLDRIESLVVR